MLSCIPKANKLVLKPFPSSLKLSSSFEDLLHLELILLINDIAEELSPITKLPKILSCKLNLFFLDNFYDK